MVLLATPLLYSSDGYRMHRMTCIVCQPLFAALHVESTLLQVEALAGRGEL